MKRTKTGIFIISLIIINNVFSVVEDRFKPFEEKDKKKINSLNTPNNQNQGILIN